MYFTCRRAPGPMTWSGLFDLTSLGMNGFLGLKAVGGEPCQGLDKSVVISPCYWVGRDLCLRPSTKKKKVSKKKDSRRPPSPRLLSLTWLSAERELGEVFACSKK